MNRVSQLFLSKKRLVACLAAVMLMACAAAVAFVPQVQRAFGLSEPTEIKIMFTHDIHSFLEPTKGYVDGEVREHGGAARLATLLKENSTPNTIYLDAGDFSQGTLFQAGYTSDAYELRILGELGCAVTTFGNHEWDHAGNGVAKMLRAAKASGSPLPTIVQSNLDFTGELTEEQQNVQAAFNEYGVLPYTIIEVGGAKVGVFGLSGINSIEDSPTSGMTWVDYIEAAKQMVSELRDQVDLLVCLSHSGTSGDGKEGEDFDLIDEVQGIDVIISGHSHSAYSDVAKKGKTFVASTGEYLNNVGMMTIEISADGKVTCPSYELLPIDETVEADPAIEKIISGYKDTIKKTYLADYGASYDEIICRSNFDFMPLADMYATHQEYPMGDLIADSYLYEANKVGVNDIDVALVGLGTIRGSFFAGPITTAGAFEICSLGVGSDDSAGHPILMAYITGEELKLLVELDASLGPMVSSIKMSYAGLAYTFNDMRMILDRVTDVALVRADGSTEQIEDDKLYKVSCNMYAANMLGMLNGLTKGALKIEPKYADGTPVEDFYTCALLDKKGKEVKEWVAFRDYLSSFAKGSDGVPVIPDVYQADQQRKVKVSEGGLKAIENPGTPTITAGLIVLLAAMILVFGLVRLTRRSKKRKEAANADKLADDEKPEATDEITVDEAAQERDEITNDEKPADAENLAGDEIADDGTVAKETSEA